jgi:PAS domain S-box-containing protein
MTLIFRVISVGLLLILPPLQPLWAGQPMETKRVLILYSEDKAHPAHELTDQGIRSALRSNTQFDVQLYNEYLDASRFSGPANAHAFADYLGCKYAGTKIDAIITVYLAALDFLMGQEGNAFPGVPIVACEIDRSTAENLERSPLRRLITGLILGDNIAGILDSAFRLKPDTKRVALVAGTSPSDVFGEMILRRGLTLYARKLDLIDLTKLPMQEILARVGSLPPDTIVLYSAIFRDGAGQSFVPREALSRISAASNGPVFGFYDTFVGYGIVGGRLVSFEQQGREAATLALRFMAGESPASIPFGGEQAYVNLYDWRELKRWNIPETAVPPGSEVRYREPSLWRDYKGIIISVIGLIIIETFLILGLVINLQRRRKAEQSLRESEERVKLAVSSAGAGVWSADVGTGRIWATDRARDLFGFAPQEPLDYERVLSRIHPAERDLVRRSLQQAMESGEEAILENRVVLSDGNIRWIATRGRLQQNSPRESKRLMGVCVDTTARKLAEETLKQRENELMALTGRIIYAQEEELRRLSRELHDDLTQRLAALALDAALIEKQLNSAQPQAVQDLKDLRTNLAEVADEVHNLSRQLHPSILDDLGLVQAVQAECATFTKKTGIDLSFMPHDVPDSVPQQLALCLYRVIREGLQNIAKHSRAAAASITVQGLSDGIRLLVQDKGIGFDSKEVKRKAGIGLSSMRERVRLVNGTMAIESKPGKGTEIQVFIPLGGEHDQATAADSGRP